MVMNGFYRVQIMFKGEEASNKVLKYLTFDEVDDLCVDYNKIIPIEDTMENRIAKWNAIGLPNNTRYLKANANECELTFDNDLFVPSKIIEALSNKLIDIEIKGQYALNNCTNKCGIFFTDFGKLNVIEFSSDSKESKDVWNDLFEE